MVQEVLIKVVGDTKGIQDTISQLEKVGKVDKVNADQFKKTQAEHKVAMQQTGQQAGYLNDQFKQLGSTIIGAFAVTSVIAFAKESIKAFAEAEKGAIALKFALNNNTKALAEMDKQAAKYKATGLFDDDDITKGQVYLAQQGRTEAQILKTMDAAVAYAITMDTDLQTAVQQMDATFEGSIGRLAKRDKAFKELTQTQLANGEAIDLVNEKYGKNIAAMENTTAAKLGRLSNIWSDLQETVGEKLVDSFDRLNPKGKDFWTNAKDYGLAALGPLDDMLTWSVNMFTGVEEVDNAMRTLSENISIADAALNALQRSNDAKSGILGELGKKSKERKADPAALKKEQDDLIALFTLEQKIALERYKLMEDDEFKRQLFALKQQELLNEKKLQILGKAYQKEYELEKLVVANKLQEFGISYEKYLKEQNEKELKSKEEALKDWERIEKEKIKIREDLQKLEQSQQKLMFTKQQAFEYAEFMKGNPAADKIAAFEEAQAADKMQFELEQLKMQYANLNKEDVNYAQNKLALEQSIADKEAEIQRQSIANQARADEEANRKKEERAKERLEFAKQIEEAYFEQLDKQHEYNMKMLDREIDKQKSNIEIQQDLANRGLENTLSFEKAKAEALEKQKLEAERKEKQRQKKKEAAELVLAFYSAYQENVKSGEKPTQALANAFKSTMLAKMLGTAIAMMEDGGIVGIDGKPLTNMGVVQGARHSQGGVTVNMEGGEGLFSRKEMANMGAVNFYNLKRLLKTNRMPVDGGGGNNAAILMGIDRLNNTFQDIPKIMYDVDGLGQLVKTEVRNGMRTITTQKRRSVN